MKLLCGETILSAEAAPLKIKHSAASSEVCSRFNFAQTQQAAGYFSRVFDLRRDSRGASKQAIKIIAEKWA